MSDRAQNRQSDRRVIYLVRLGPPGKGDTIHKSTCRYAQVEHACRWTYAEANPDRDWATEAPWLKRCQVCHPPSPFGTYEVLVKDV